MRAATLWSLSLLAMLPWTAGLRGQTAPPAAPLPGTVLRLAGAQPPSGKLPTGVILIKGAEPSASDHVTPLPEEGAIAGGLYRNRYFGLSYPLPSGWTQKYAGPPPSDGGGYVLAQIEPAEGAKGSPGTLLITARDLFFSEAPSASAMEVVRHARELLPSYYEVEHPPAEVRLGDRSFVRFDYLSAVAGLHWYLLTTEVRCHAVQFIFTSQDTKLLERLIRDLAKTALAEEKGGGELPLCLPGYAARENVVTRVEPALTDRRFNAVPVRIVVGKDGKVKHVHVISAFAEQSRSITDALLQWTFKPYLRDGQPVEVETGLFFGSPPAGRGAVAENARGQ